MGNPGNDERFKCLNRITDAIIKNRKFLHLYKASTTMRLLSVRPIKKFINRDRVFFSIWIVIEPFLKSYVLKPTTPSLRPQKFFR